MGRLYSMYTWKDLMNSHARNMSNADFTKLNVVQQEVADLFMGKKLTKDEVFLILHGLLDKEMVNKKNAERYFRGNYDAIVKSEFKNTEGFYEHHFNKENKQ